MFGLHMVPCHALLWQLTAAEGSCAVQLLQAVYACCSYTPHHSLAAAAAVVHAAQHSLSAAAIAGQDAVQDVRHPLPSQQ
jgi:hypothetical protein